MCGEGGRGDQASTTEEGYGLAAMWGLVAIGWWERETTAPSATCRCTSFDTHSQDQRKATKRPRHSTLCGWIGRS